MKVVYGMPAAASAPHVQFGVARGLFRDEGIDLEVRALYGGPAIARALGEGSLDFGHMGTPPAIVAHGEGGARFRIVASGIKRKAHLYLAVRGGIAGPQALPGARLGLLSLGSCDEWIGRRMLQVLGVPEGSVEMTAIAGDYDRLPELFAEGRIDASLAIEPNTSAAEARGLARVWAAAHDDPYLPSFQWTVVVASDALIRRDPALLRALLRAYVRSCHAARDHREEYARFAAGALRLPLEVVASSIAREMPHYEFDGKLDREGLRTSIELQASLRPARRAVSERDLLDAGHLPLI